MTVLSGQTIRRLGLLDPCEEPGTHKGVSHGLGPAGYDLRLVLPDDRPRFGLEQDSIVINPGEFLLVAAAERFNIPADIMAIAHDKSTWARKGLTVQNTVAEPGWRGYLTLELTNHGPEPLVLYAGQGIAQIVFHRLDEPAERPYRGKYQDQAAGPQAARS